MNRSTLTKVGLIVTFALLALLWGVNFLKGKGAFNQDDIYYVVYDRIDGLEVSSPVLMNGFKVGQVRQINFSSDTSGRLIVEFAIKNKFKIPGKSVARIYSSDLMGTKAIDLKFGNADYLQQSGDTLIADFEGSLQEMVSLQMLPLKSKAEDLMKEIEEAIEIVKYIFNEETRDDVSASFKNIKNTFANLEKSSVNLDSIVHGSKGKLEIILSNIESISSNIENNNEAITSAIQNFSSISDSLVKADFAAVIRKTEHVMIELDLIASKINNGDGTMGMLINNDTLYNNLADATYNLNRLMEDLRINPKRYVQFSAFNLGKTVYAEEQTDKSKNPKALYKVQISSSIKSLALIPDNFKGYKNVEEHFSNKEYIYLIGNFKKVDDAKKLLSEVETDYPDAFIVKLSEDQIKPLN